MKKKGDSKLRPYAAAGYSAVAIATADEDRLTKRIIEEFPNRQVLRVAAAGGVCDLRTGKSVVPPPGSYPQAYERAWTRKGQDDAPIVIVLDLQHVVKGPAQYRMLRDALPKVKEAGGLLVLLAPDWRFPPELAHDIPVIQDALPTREELAERLAYCATSAEVEQPSGDDKARLLDAASGLTLAEAENTYALSFAELGAFDVTRVSEEKLALVRQSGYLEVTMPAPVDSLGGLGAWKKYVAEEVVPCQGDPELMVRGVLFCGISGTGKSLAAKVASSMLRWTCLRLDVGSLKAGLVGQSEAQLDAALRLAEAVAPTVLFLDEIEKAIGGYESSAHTDSGVTLGMVGKLLTWLQDHKAQILTIATCNDYSKLPPEFTRAGRFDERFFVDLPTVVEREEIAAVHLARFGAQGTVDKCAGFVAGRTEDWTGAEIEALVRSAARRSQRAITPAALESAAQDIKPISKVRGDEVAKLRTWGKENLRLANTPEGETPKRSRRVTAAERPAAAKKSTGAQEFVEDLAVMGDIVSGKLSVGGGGNA